LAQSAVQTIGRPLRLSYFLCVQFVNRNWRDEISAYRNDAM
jgi:hypothetical protein